MRKTFCRSAPAAAIGLTVEREGAKRGGFGQIQAVNLTARSDGARCQRLRNASAHK